MLQPLGKRIFIEVIPEENQDIPKIITLENPQSYRVYAIGDEVTKLAVKDIVILGYNTFSSVKFGDKIYFMTLEDNVVAKEVV